MRNTRFSKYSTTCFQKAAFQLVFLIGISGATQNLFAESCFDLYRLSSTERALEPGIIVAASKGVPEHCVVRGVLNRSIRFEIRMPVRDWSGRFLMLGTGGASGYIPVTTNELIKGYATASTDTGHIGSGLDFFLEPEAALDYAFRAVHLVAQLSKEVITTYYDRKIDYAYYNGCSNGGRQGLIEATRYPDDFDGIIAGAPLLQMAREYFLWVLTVHRAQRANPLTEAQLTLLGDASRNACDLLDGVEDGVINDPRLCTSDLFNPASLLCKPGQDQDSCVSIGQLETINQHYDGVLDNDGNALSPGLMPGAEDAGSWRMYAFKGIPIPSTNEIPEDSINGFSTEMIKYYGYRDPNYNVEDFDIIEDRDDMERASTILDVNTADLSSFQKHGGKLLVYQGWNDYPTRPQQAIDYLHRVNDSNGGASEVKKFFRLFMIPGMLHCSGGPGAYEVDYLEPLVQWVEKGDVPNELIGSRPDGKFTRKHCAFPEIARYDKGDSTLAENFQCAK